MIESAGGGADGRCKSLKEEIPGRYSVALGKGLT